MKKFFNRKLFFAFYICCVIAFLLEFTFFNYTHYSHFFAGKEIYLKYNGETQKFESNAPNMPFVQKRITEDNYFVLNGKDKIVFENLNEKIVSVFIAPKFHGKNKIQKVNVAWQDDESTRSISVAIIKGLEFSNYISIAPCGSVKNLAITLPNNTIAIKSIELNKKIPIFPMPLRILGLSFIFFFVYLVKNHRKKVSYYLFELKFNKNLKKQKAAFMYLILVIISFNLFVSYSVYNFQPHIIKIPNGKEYNSEQYAYLADALLKGQIHLDNPVSEKLLNTKRPYDNNHRMKNKIDVLWDFAYYNGKYYCYFGVVPAVILFVPFKFITGNYLPSDFAVFLFASFASIFMLLIWRRITIDYLKNIPFFFFLLGGLTFVMCSFLVFQMARPMFYEVASSSGLAFVMLGFFLLLKSVSPNEGKYFHTKIFFACLCFALAVGCRPNMVFWSVLVPVILWDKIKVFLNFKKFNIADFTIFLTAITVPFVIVAIPLMWYNFARFGPVADFGQYFQITVADNTQLPNMNIIGKFWIIVRCLLLSLFNFPNIDASFPFFTPNNGNVVSPAMNWKYIAVVVGLFSIPVNWFIFNMKQVSNKLLKRTNYSIFAITLISIIFIGLLAGTDNRYSGDFAGFITLSSLICAYYLQNSRKYNLKLIYICLTISVMMFFFLSFYGTGNVKYNNFPEIYHYFARTFGIIANQPIY